MSEEQEQEQEGSGAKVLCKRARFDGPAGDRAAERPWVLKKRGLFLQACEISYQHPRNQHAQGAGATAESGDGTGNGETCCVPEVPRFEALRVSCGTSA